MIESYQLEKNHILSIVGAAANDFLGQRCIVPVWKRGMSNLTVSNSSGDYDGGDRVIGLGAYAVDGDLLITSGWGDGAAIRRINNDGTLTKLWHDNYALYRDTTSTYNHINSLAIHAGSSQICLTTHNVDGYSMIDYSDLKVGGSTVINTRPSSKYVFSTGASIDRSGSYYTTGTVTAGDWLYVLDYDATHYQKIPRRHWVTGAEELLDGSSLSSPDLYTGSAAIDRNGYRGYVAYDEVNDRVFYNYYYNANLTVILAASTSAPKILWCDIGDTGNGDDGYEHGLFIPDPVNEPNKVLVGGSSRLVYMDISPCLTGSAPTIIKRFWVEDGTRASHFGVEFKAGTVRQSNSGAWIDKHPTDQWFCPTTSDRGRNMLDGWLDWDNEMVVGLLRHDTVIEDTTTGGRGRSYISDYGNPVFRMQSADGTYWWVKVGYGYDGHGFRVWSDTYKNELVGNWEITYGTYSLSNSTNIDFVNWDQEDYYTPSSCNISFYVSNDNGTTWEAYTGGVHYFTSSGTQLRTKIIATGQSTKAPYKMSTNFDTVTFGAVYEGFKNTEIPIKIERFRLAGKKI